MRNRSRASSREYPLFLTFGSQREQIQTNLTTRRSLILWHTTTHKLNCYLSQVVGTFPNPQDARGNSNMPEMMTADEVGQILKVPAPYVYRLARRGLLKSVKLNRYVRFTQSSVDEFIASNMVQSA